MESELSITGVILGILVFILVFRNWKSLGLLEWIGAFIFAGTIGSMLGWLWESLPATQQETYLIYLAVGGVGLLLLHFGDVISTSLRAIMASLNPDTTERTDGYMPSMARISFFLLVVALVLITEPFLHLIGTVLTFIETVLNELFTSLQEFDLQISGNLWLIVVGIIILAISYMFYTARRKNSTIRSIVDEFNKPVPGGSDGCAFPALIIVLVIVLGVVVIV